MDRRHIVDEQEEELGFPSSSSSSGNESTNSSASSSSDLVEDASSSPSSSSFSSSSGQHLVKNPLYQMSELMEELPIKRGLSRHFDGKSQSFTSLSNVRCLEDLVKPEVRPWNRKRLKPCKSYAGGLDHTNNQKPISPKGCCSRIICKKPSSMAKRHHHGFLGARPPTHPHSSGNLSGHALLFA